MMVGIISDTHDNLPLVDRAVKKLNSEGVTLVLHAGDYVAPFVIPKFKELKSRIVGVLGNNDGDRELLKKRAAEHGNMELRGNFAEVQAGNVKIALIHGHEDELLKALINGQSFEVVVHGHTHMAEVYRKGRTLVVNPGEVCGYITGKSTISLLDTERLEAKIIEI
ncbi:MAG: metallophosphoesterase [Candidatus Bathyarchaeota archaeon]|nr:metallophosphoesterase [Candidatus Bathyarchaeota archaeon]MCX8177242.1 metallophosphoesterase [Candidatus Bathyarchaeota archaeon]MDW8193515.1 metallophosphoesterase [Nitrososphaerota archaeon]